LKHHFLQTCPNLGIQANYAFTTKGNTMSVLMTRHSPRQRLKTVLVLVFLSLTAGACFADGKLYVTERVPPGIPYQRAILMFQDGKGTLTPKEMETDLVFTPAPDNKAYRKRVIRW
jgi:hypothetical protein